MRVKERREVREGGLKKEREKRPEAGVGEGSRRKKRKTEE